MRSYLKIDCFLRQNARFLKDLTHKQSVSESGLNQRQSAYVPGFMVAELEGSRVDQNAKLQRHTKRTLSCAAMLEEKKLQTNANKLFTRF